MNRLEEELADIERQEAIDMLFEATAELERLGYPKTVYICGKKVIELRPDENKIVIR